MVNYTFYHYQILMGQCCHIPDTKWPDSVVKLYSYYLIYPYSLRNMLIINEEKDYTNLYAWKCNVVITVYIVCKA